MMAPLLEVMAVSRVFTSGGLLGRHRVLAVDNVSLTIEQDEPQVLAIIGESGSGKTTLARMILNIVPPTTCSIRFRGEVMHHTWRRQQRLAFMRQVQPIFQNPFEAFNPLKRVDRYLFMTAHRFAPGDAVRNVDAALRQVGLSLGEVRGRYPHELSGGQLQRIAIARALVSAPALIVADEPVSMVDASLRMSIVNLFSQLRDTLRVSIIYITHDLATAYSISDRIIIMRNGSVVEAGAAHAVLDNPQHPYSQQLKGAVLSIDAAA
jgi:peptide/nickel transport system ATP-binding protein